MTDHVSDQPVDALDVISSQDTTITELFVMWRRTTEQLLEAENVDLRWRRGSAVKMLLQHLAVREAAKDALVRRLREDGHNDLASKLDGDAVSRREHIATLDELARGQQAISLNFPEIDQVIVDLGSIFDRESSPTRTPWRKLPACWGQPASGGCPAPGASVCKASLTLTPSLGGMTGSPVLKAIRAFYDHLRTAPSGAVNPTVDTAREHLPDPGSEHHA